MTTYDRNGWSLKVLRSLVSSNEFIAKNNSNSSKNLLTIIKLKHYSENLKMLILCNMRILQSKLNVILIIT